MACGHIWKQINDVGVCQKCGLTISKKGEIMFDRSFISQKKRRSKKCAKK